MAFVLADRVQETATANTTVSFTLSGAVSGYQSFSAIGNGNTTYYSATDGTNWEVGYGTYTSSGTTLSRDTILSSSNSGSAVTFSGTVIVFVDYPSSKQISSDYPNALGVVTPAAGTFNTLIGGKSSTTYVTITGDASYPMVQATGGTNTPLVLSPLGTGALQAQKTDSTTAGGNARGANAVDWQTSRSNASNVASATSATLGGGADNRVTGSYATVAGGSNNFVTASQSIVAGGYNNYASGIYSAIVGGFSNGSSSAVGYFNFLGGGAYNTATSNLTVTTQSGTMNGTTAVTLSGSNASIKVGQYIQGTSIATGTYVAAISGTSLTLSQNASGSSTSTLSFYTPHGVVVGGGNNQATGSYSFIGGGGDAGTAANRNVASGDWSFVGGGIKNVASGLGSAVVGGGLDSASNINGNTSSGASAVVCGGRGNTASGNESTVLGGAASTANGLASMVQGRTSTTRGITGNVVFAGSYSPISGTGSSQAGLLVLATQTTNATATVLTNNGSAAGTTNQVILPNNSAYYFRGEVVSGVTGGGDTKGWSIEGVIKRGADAASTTLVGSTVTSLYADAGAATWTIGLTADTTNGGLKVTFTGQASTTIRTVCQIRTTEMTY